MELLAQLGINKTLFFQLIIFTITILFLSLVVFEPYLKVFEQRKVKTKGYEDNALELKKQTEEIQAHYEVKARGLNDELRAIFDRAKKDAMIENQKLFDAKKVESDLLLEKSRLELAQQASKAESMLDSEVPLVTKEILKKFLMGPSKNLENGQST
jgi:F0F1-type ATP synthase membrane subunit b/b'